MIEPQPHSKRTAEGDLGTYVSAKHVVEMLAEQERPVRLPPPLPATREEIAAALTLTHFAAVTLVCSGTAGQLAHLADTLHRPCVRHGRGRGRPTSPPAWACAQIGTGAGALHAPARRGGGAGGLARQGRWWGATAAAAGRAHRPRPALHLRLLPRPRPAPALRPCCRAHVPVTRRPSAGV